jgi:protein-disulfide isomerase
MSTQEIKNKNGLSIPGAIVLAGIIIAGAITLPRMSGVDTRTAMEEAAVRTAAGTGSGNELVNSVNSDDFVRGNRDARVKIVEFSDFGCSFCASFHPTLARVVEEYPEDVAWVYRHLPFRNIKAAQASECVGQRLGNDAFWSYTDKLFESFPAITDNLMEQEAVRLGFATTEDFWECQSSQAVVDAVALDSTEARLMGVSGTPYSLIMVEGGRNVPLRGAMEYEQVKQVVELFLSE